LARKDTTSLSNIALVLALSAFSISPASAQGIEAFTGGDLRDACDSLVLAVRGISPIAQDDAGAMLCLGFIAGWTQAMEHVPDRSYCLPPVQDSLPGDLADLIVTYVDGHPDSGTAAAHEIVLQTFEDAFPCPTAEQAEESADEQP